MPSCGNVSSFAQRCVGMVALETPTLMFANAVIAASVAAMSHGYAHLHPRARLVAIAWGRLMLVFALASFTWFLSGMAFDSPLSWLGNCLFALVPPAAVHALGHLVGSPPRKPLLLAMALPGIVGATAIWFWEIPRYFASIPIGAALVFAALWGLVVLALRQFKQRSVYGLGLLVTLLVAVVANGLRLVAASSGLSEVVVPVANTVIQTLALLAATLFLSAGSLCVFGLLEEGRHDLVAEEGRRDGLTGLLQRQPFMRQATDVLERVRAPFALIMLDIDDFKSINDQHGHPAGDAVIPDCGKVIAECVRAGDIAGRLGGEEFAVLLPRCQPDEAVTVAQRIRESIAQRVVVAGKSGLLRYSASLGVANGVASGNPSVKLLDALERADAALYVAKDAGKNCVALDDHGLVAERRPAESASAPT